MSFPIHTHACADCPSTKDLSGDLIMQDLAASPKSVQAAHAFVCGWRPGKVCRGYCNLFDLSDTDLPEREPIDTEAIYAKMRTPHG